LKLTDRSMITSCRMNGCLQVTTGVEFNCMATMQSSRYAYCSFH